MRRRKHQTRLQSIGDALEKILSRHNIQVSSDKRQLVALWNKAAGPQIAAQSRPDRLQRGVLSVKVASSVWMHQLQFLKPDILEKLSRSHENKAIREIRFSLDEMPMPSSMSIQPVYDFTAYPLKPRDMKMIEKSTAEVGDQELRDLLKRVMTKEIIRRRIMEKKGGR